MKIKNQAKDSEFSVGRDLNFGDKIVHVIIRIMPGWAWMILLLAGATWLIYFNAKNDAEFQASLDVSLFSLEILHPQENATLTGGVETYYTISGRAEGKIPNGCDLWIVVKHDVDYFFILDPIQIGIDSTWSKNVDVKRSGLSDIQIYASDRETSNDLKIFLDHVRRYGSIQTLPENFKFITSRRVKKVNTN